MSRSCEERDGRGFNPHLEHHFFFAPGLHLLFNLLAFTGIAGSGPGMAWLVSQLTGLGPAVSAGAFVFGFLAILVRLLSVFHLFPCYLSR
ncbi:hypothetical protein V1515DRAFT_610557 [Lipomyces mesembrius]